MKFFMTGELGINDADHAIDLIKDVENKIKILEINDYGDIDDIGIIPVIMSPEFDLPGFFGERKLVKRKSREADYRLRINYCKYIATDDVGKTMLIIKNVIDSIRDIGRKVKGFNASKFEEDILALFGISYQDIEKV